MKETEVPMVPLETWELKGNQVRLHQEILGFEVQRVQLDRMEERDNREMTGMKGSKGEGER